MAKEDYQAHSKNNRKMPKNATLIKEMIVNLEEHHTLKDLQPIINKLESYGFKVLQASIHRDEGFVNSDNKKEKNYHAHITMFNLDVTTGKTVKFGKSYRTELSKLQTFTAKTLNMQRGKVSVKEHAKELNVKVEKASKRLDTHEYKRAMILKELKPKTQNNQNQKKIELQKLVIAGAKYNFREMQKMITDLQDLTNEQKRELHRLNSQVKNDTATIEDLEITLEASRERASEKIAQRNKYREQLTEALETIEDLEMKLEVNRERVNSMAKQRNKYREQLMELEGREPEIREVIKEVPVEKIVYRDREVIKEVPDAHTQNKLIEAQETIKSLKAVIDTLESNKSSYRQDIANLQAQNRQLQAREPEIREIIKEVPDAYTQNKLTEARETIKSLKATIETIESDANLLRYKNIDLNNRVQKLQMEEFEKEKYEYKAGDLQKEMKSNSSSYKQQRW